MNPQITPNAYGSERRSVRRRTWRFVTAGIATVLIFGGLGIRLTAIQIDGGGGSRDTGALPAGHRIVERSIAPDRGVVLDRKGRLLAKNIATYSVQIRPGDLPLPIRPQVVETLAKILRVDPVAITMTLDRATGSLWDPVRIANKVDEVAARLIAEEHVALPGVETLFEPQRVYPYGELFAAVVGYVARIDAQEASALSDLGYTSSDFIGRSGIELSYEAELRGTSGIRQIEIDAQGRTVRDLGVIAPAVPGKTVVLTIDAVAQRTAFRALSWGLKAAGNKEGVLASMNPQNGEIIAMASLPTFNPNDFAQGITNTQYAAYLRNQHAPLVNHAVASIYPPGSTYKLVTYSCALESNLVQTDDRFAATPYLEVDGEKFWEWNKPPGFGGMMTPAVGFSFSSNVVTFRITRVIKLDRLAPCGRQWGFAQPTGIDLPSEGTGVVPDNDWARLTINRTLYNGEVLQSAQGQGYDLATPVQLLNAYAALANGGTRWVPRVVLELRSADGLTVEATEPTVLGEVGMRASVLAEMRRAGHLVVVNPRMYFRFNGLPLNLSAKTGTAQFGTRDKRGNLPYHNWFSGFVAPTSDWSKTDATFAFVAFMHSSNTVGNAGVEVTKKYLQLHFKLNRSWVVPSYLRIGNHYGQ